MTKPAKTTPFDTVYEVETPEAINLNAYIVGPLPRVLAYSIDLTIRLLFLGAISIVLLFMDDAGWGIFLIISFMLEWFYPVLFEVLRQGQTPGKKMMEIAVVNDDLTPVTWSSSIIRNLLRAVDILPFAYVAGLLSITCSRHFQRLGDFAAGTVVVYQVDVKAEADLPEVTPVPPAVRLSENDQITLASFTRRHANMTPARQEELANILEPMTHKTGREAVNYLHALGAWLLGKER